MTITLMNKDEVFAENVKIQTLSKKILKWKNRFIFKFLTWMRWLEIPESMRNWIHWIQQFQLPAIHCRWPMICRFHSSTADNSLECCSAAFPRMKSASSLPFLPQSLQAVQRCYFDKISDRNCRKWRAWLVCVIEGSWCFPVKLKIYFINSKNLSS